MTIRQPLLGKASFELSEGPAVLQRLRRNPLARGTADESAQAEVLGSLDSYVRVGCRKYMSAGQRHL